jgi:hypothetical protein
VPRRYDSADQEPGQQLPLFLQRSLTPRLAEQRQLERFDPTDDLTEVEIVV